MPSLSKVEVRVPSTLRSLRRPPRSFRAVPTSASLEGPRQGFPSLRGPRPAVARVIDGPPDARAFGYVPHPPSYALSGSCLAQAVSSAFGSRSRAANTAHIGIVPPNLAISDTWSWVSSPIDSAVCSSHACFSQ